MISDLAKAVAESAVAAQTVDQAVRVAVDQGLVLVAAAVVAAGASVQVGLSVCTPWHLFYERLQSAFMRFMSGQVRGNT